jgi:hypothetical protein
MTELLLYDLITMQVLIALVIITLLLIVILYVITLLLYAFKYLLPKFVPIILYFKDLYFKIRLYFKDVSLYQIKSIYQMIPSEALVLGTAMIGIGSADSPSGFNTHELLSQAKASYELETRVEQRELRTFKFRGLAVSVKMKRLDADASESNLFQGDKSVFDVRNVKAELEDCMNTPGFDHIDLKEVW